VQSASQEIIVVLKYYYLNNIYKFTFSFKTMELTGSHTLNAPAQKIWDMLMTPDILAKVTPGISRLELESEGIYKAIAEVKIGPVSGKFEGKAEVADPIAPQSFTLKVQQNSKIGNVSADIRMVLKPLSDTETELSFEGKADMSGLLARTGNRVMSGVAGTLTKQFFKNFEEELSQ
jgi:carbon monoxide dehydrogenase subunit G